MSQEAAPGTRNHAVPAVEVDNVSKYYPSRGLLNRLKGAWHSSDIQALDGVSFSIAPGETVGLLGPNGAGKTTILKILATMLYPSSGRVLIHGTDVVKDSLRTRGNIGLVTSDERSFYWRLSGRQNLNFFATLYGLSEQQANDRVEELLDYLGLAFAADRPFHGYSSGMKQKMAIARGQLSHPRLILYDEPTRSLDPLSAKNIRQWLVSDRDRFPETTHLIATNQLHEAEELCDRVLIINRGVLIASGTVAAIRKRFRPHTIHRIRTRGFRVDERLGPGTATGLLEVNSEAEEGDIALIRIRTTDEGDALSRVLETILRGGGTVLGCDTEQATFDDVFCSLVLDFENPSGTSSAGGGGVR